MPYTENEDVDPSFDFNSSLKEDDEHIVESFCENYVLQFNRDERVELGLFLCFQLEKHLGLGDTKAAELAGMMVVDVISQSELGDLNSMPMVVSYQKINKASTNIQEYFGAVKISKKGSQMCPK